MATAIEKKRQTYTLNTAKPNVTPISKRNPVYVQCTALLAYYWILELELRFASDILWSFHS